MTCWIRLLSSGAFAAQVLRLQRGEGLPALSPMPDIDAPSIAAPKPEIGRPITGRSHASVEALQLLEALQRDGRFVDFVQQDIQNFEDAAIGVAARVVHAGCRKVLQHHFEIVPVRDEDEGVSVTLEPGYDSESIKLTGNVAGAGPYRGVVRHRGWRVTRVRLPELVDGHDAHLIAPAEVEL